MKTLRDRRRQPTHPGTILREDVLPALRMSQTEFAERLGVSRVTVNTLLQEKRDLSVELAARIAKLLGHSPEIQRDWRMSSRCRRSAWRLDANA